MSYAREYPATYINQSSNELRGLNVSSIIIDEANHLTSTNVQDALNILNTGLTGIEWREDGPYVNGSRFTNLEVSDGFLTSNDINIDMNARIYNPEIEELRNEVSKLREEIDLLKMLLLEN